jgi:hypothetical protein
MRHYLEIRTTISPTPYFFRRIHYLAASIKDLGGKLADHEIVVSVGGNEPRENLYRTQPWSNRYPILWRWVDPEAYALSGYKATGRDRCWHMARARLVMFVDADVIFIRDFSDMLSEIEREPAICGVMAHVSPFQGRREHSPQSSWQQLARSFGIADLPADCEHSGWNCMFTDETYRYTPPYFNGGMIVGPVDLMDRMCALIPAAEDAVDAVLESYFRPQLSRTLAIYKDSLPYRVLPLRFNFPNDPRFEPVYPAELADLRILHYLRWHIVHRDRDFMNSAAVAGLLARDDLTGSNETLRLRIAELHDAVAAEAGEGGQPTKASGGS